MKAEHLGVAEAACRNCVGSNGFAENARERYPQTTRVYSHTNCRASRARQRPGMALISVIIPAFNSGPHLRETLECVLAQTHRETEVIVVDDGSTDGTPDVIRSFAGRIRAVRQKNRGIGAARNRGFQ